MIKKLIIPALLCLLFASCEKVIDVKLDNATPQYVIEAELFEGTHPFRVHVALTTDYFGSAAQQEINDAVVTLYDSAGNAITVPLTTDGWYELPAYSAAAGSTYRLKVVTGGKEFTAEATVPYIVPIDSIDVVFKKKDFRKAGYQVAALFTDPAGTRNFYRLILSVNDTLQNDPQDLYILNDKYNDGKQVTADVFKRYQAGDKITFELRGMDEQVFDFFNSLNEVLNNPNGPAPANPNSNIKGGALGYFGAFTSSEKSIVITP